MCHDGIGAGQINQKVSLSLTLTASAGIDHGFAGPVSGVLVQSGQCIEDGAFPDIGISGKGDDQIILVQLLKKGRADRVLDSVSSRIDSQSHQPHLDCPEWESGRVRTKICRES